MDKVYIISGLLSFLSFPLIAQNSDYQAQYREKVLEYNQDLKAAGYNEAMKQEMIKSVGPARRTVQGFSPGSAAANSGGR